MKVLLTTIAIGDKYLEEYKNLFYESHKNYSEKHGYDFKLITEFLDKNNQFKSTISFNKILVCSQEWSADYDFIIFVDADILININSPAIHNYIEYGDSIGIINEYSQPSIARRLLLQRKMKWERSANEYYKLCGFDLQTNIVLNTGLIVMQPQKHRTFLENVYNKYIKQSITHPRGFHFEQSCIGYELQKSNMYKILDNKFNAIWLLVKFNNIENISLDSFFDGNYFLHFVGRMDFDKVKDLQTRQKPIAI